MRELGPRHIASVDARMAGVIAQVGACELPTRHGRYRSLVRAIISQQVSVAAAATVHRRLRERCGGHITAKRVAALSEAQLRGVGLSGRKVAYVQDLTRRVGSGDLRLERLPALDDEALIAELTRVKGIGRWSAEMFLIFVLGRPDVMPVGDLALQNACRRIYDLRERPDAAKLQRLAAPWKPYRTIGAWYLWRSLDLTAL